MLGRLWTPQAQRRPAPPAPPRSPRSDGRPAPARRPAIPPPPAGALPRPRARGGRAVFPAGACGGGFFPVFSARGEDDFFEEAPPPPGGGVVRRKVGGVEGAGGALPFCAPLPPR